MALGTNLPFWPALVFTYIEPLSLYISPKILPNAILLTNAIRIVGLHATFSDPKEFIARQLPSATLVVPDSALVLSYTLGNVFLVLAFLAILCTAITRDARVTWYYLFFIAFGDLGHIFASYKVMGPDVFLNFSQYNSMMWGNVGMSAFLHINRAATILGLFGKIGR